jgi:thiamine pyrophosphate-dependent acetolactate synthase large subunit-like protein
MRSLIQQFVDRRISRRDFGLGLGGLGLSAAAVESVLQSMALAQEPPPAAGIRIQGTGAEILVETLRAAAIPYVFATTATGMSPFFDALAVRPDPKLILSIAESQATSMAHGYELASGNTSALFLPGVAIPSAMNNLYNAWKDRSAIAVFSDGPSNKLPGRNMFQQMDDWLDPMVQFTKWRWQVDNDRQISEMVRRAIKVADTPPGGPVHIRFPLNILGARDLKQTIYPQSRFTVPMEIRPKPELVEQAAQLLLNAEQPLISVGAEVTRAGANDALIEFAELLGIPVAQGFSVYGDFPFRHPLFAGHYGLGVPRGLAGMDVFLNLGGQMPDPGIFTAPVPRKAKVIHARIEYEDIASIYPTDVAIAAGLKETITELTDAVKGMATADRLQRLSAGRMEAARSQMAKRTVARKEKAREYWDASPMSWERVSAELDLALEDDAIIVSEIDYRTPLEWLDFGRGKKWLIGETTGFALGWGLGAALGVKIARPDRQVVCLVGDGALLFGQLEALWTASRYDIPALILVFNNRSYDNERNRIKNNSPLWQNRETRDLWKDMTGYLGKPVVDFTGIAKSFDIPAAMVSTPADLQRALKRARAVTREGRPFLIDAVIMQLDRKGRRTEATWYPELSIAAVRSRKV